MHISQFQVKVGNDSVKAELAIPEGEQVKGNLVIFLAHGNNHKHGMHEEVIDYLFKGLARRGFVTVRFNFLFVEKKRKTKDDNQTLVRTYNAVYKEIMKLKPQTVIIGGFSLGSWMAAFMARKGLGDGVLLLGFPLTHNGDKIPVKKIFEIQQPMLIINGTEDKYTNPKDLMDLIEDMRRQNRSVEHFLIDMVSHGFRIPDHPTISQHDVYQEIIEMTDRWISHHWY